MDNNIQSGGHTLREPPITGEEVDAVHGRSMHKYLTKAGASAKIKRQIRRRERHKLDERAKQKADETIGESMEGESREP